MTAVSLAQRDANEPTLVAAARGGSSDTQSGVDAGLVDAKDDVGNVQPPYGSPPMDAGTGGD